MSVEIRAVDGLPDRVYRVHHGLLLLQDPYLNKGTAFSMEERDVLRLHGFLPPHVGTIEEQSERRMEALSRLETPLQRYLFLRELQDLNETLFYYLCHKHMDKVLPLIYTPTVGNGCLEYSHTFRRPRGLFLGWPHRDRLYEILADPHFDDVSVICVTDGERILGLGDQGAGGMGIPIGKLSLYTACAGIHPRRTLPVLLDVGTDNPTALTDPLYIGWCHQRLRGRAYDEFVDLFVQAVKRRWGDEILLQWEDFARDNALTLLDRYKDEICSFNDDIQGTAAVVLSTILAAIQAINLPLRETRIVIRGAGSAATGIVDLIGHLLAQGADITQESEQEIATRLGRKNCWMVNRNGLLLQEDPNLEALHKAYAHNASEIEGWDCKDKAHPDLLDVINNIKPHILIGVAGRPGLFNKEVVQTMARHVDTPIIMPLSNPTVCAEAQPQDIIDWTEGKALVALGSPFPPVNFPDGSSRVMDQTNNVYIFPGLGLAILACKARRVNHKLFIAAAKAVAAESPIKKGLSATKLLPPTNTLRSVSRRVAIAVCKKAVEESLCSPLTVPEIKQLVDQNMWEPRYHNYLKDIHYFIKHRDDQQGGLVEQQEFRAERTASNESSLSSSSLSAKISPSTVDASPLPIRC